MRAVELAPDEYGSVQYRITVENISPAETRTVDIRRELPREIRFGDVLDPGGLEVATDAGSGSVSVFKDDIEIGPGETVTFNVILRDKWNVNAPRMQLLESRVTQLLARIRQIGGYESIAQSLEDLAADVEKAQAEEGPAELSEQYVAFYRRQADRLDAIETRLNRVETALQPVDKTTKWGFRVKAPSMKTTWMIIYIILGFLGLMSLLFFIRWFGRARAEPHSGSGTGSAG